MFEEYIVEHVGRNIHRVSSVRIRTRSLSIMGPLK